MKILHKGLAVLLCIMIAISATYTAPGRGAIVSLAKEAEIGHKENGKCREIKLNAGKGVAASDFIILEDGRTLPKQLPEATRTGWTFEGWYTAEVTENYWGDQEGESFSALLKKCGGNRDEAVKKDFSWIVESEGTLVKAGDEIPSNVGTLYAMYKPIDNITIRWHYNGWKKNTGIFLTHTKKEYDSPVVFAELENFLTWENHKFSGWYTADGTEWKFDNIVTDHDNGRVYYISDNVVTEDLDLYAHWTGRVEPDTIQLSNKNGLIEPGEIISITASYSPMSADAPELEWSVNGGSDVISSQKVSDDGLSITLAIAENADVLQGNKCLTVTARSQTNSALSAKTDISIGHSWKMTGYEDSSCNRAGVKHYQCTKHEYAKKDVAIDPDGHRFVKSKRITKEPTCVKEGSHTDIYSCIVCNATEQVVTKIPATGIHTWNTGEITSAPTCAETGIMTYTCAGCDLTREEVIPATGLHDYEKTSTVVNKEADCGNDGFHTDTYVCVVCGDEKTEQVTDPATGEHDFYEFVTLNFGKRNHYQACKVCGKVEFLYAEETTLDAPVIVFDDPDSSYDEDEGTHTDDDNEIGSTEKADNLTPSSNVSQTHLAKAQKQITATVNPTKPALSRVKNTKGRKILAKWKKNTAVTGYQIQYSTDKKFKSKVKKVAILKNSTVSKTIRALKKGATYSVRIRAYKTVSGTKYYSGWSDVKKVTIYK